MKILHCIPILGHGGGAERQLSYLAAALAKRGHDVHVAFAQGGGLEAPLRERGVTLHDVGGGRGNYDPRIFVRLVRLMIALRPDVVQTNLPQMDVLGGGAALVTGRRWIVRESSAAPSYPPGWKSGLRRLLARGADVVVSNSAEGDAYWRGARRRCVIPNGVPFDDVNAGGGDTILFAGRLNEGKNAGTFLDAVAILGAEAVVCGDGPLRAELEARATPRVTFAGVVTDLAERMRAAAVVVSLSRFEGSPNVVMEAMACGTPLVVSDIAAHRALLGDDAALFVGAEDASAAAAAIEATLADRDAAHTRARAARARAAQWTVEAMVDRYEKILCHPERSEGSPAAGDPTLRSG
jgi:glycosyltransferase involved in cell wall biosynthesis